MRKSGIGLLAVVLVSACGSDGDPPTQPPTTGTITGQVIDADSSNGGVSGVSVQLTGSATQTVTTNASGSFTLSNAQPGSWQAAVQVPGQYDLAANEAGTRTATVTAGQTATLTPFRLARPKGSVSGLVEEDGSPVEGGTVTAERGGFADRTATPDAGGAYAIADLPVGDWTLAYQPPAAYQLAQGETGTRDVTITESQTETVSAFQLEPAPPQPTIVEIHLSGTSFSPNSVEIDPGTIVRWINDDGQSHTVTPENSSQSGVWQRATTSSQGVVLEHTFTVANQTYRYRCEPHSSDFQNGMVGVITVR